MYTLFGLNYANHAVGTWRMHVDKRPRHRRQGRTHDPVLCKGLFTPKTRVFSAAEILLRIYIKNPYI